MSLEAILTEYASPASFEIPLATLSGELRFKVEYPPSTQARNAIVAQARLWAEANDAQVKRSGESHPWHSFWPGVSAAEGAKILSFCVKAPHWAEAEWLKLAHGAPAVIEYLLEQISVRAVTASAIRDKTLYEEVKKAFGQTQTSGTESLSADDSAGTPSE